MNMNFKDHRTYKTQGTGSFTLKGRINNDTPGLSKVAFSIVQAEIK